MFIYNKKYGTCVVFYKGENLGTIPMFSNANGTPNVDKAITEWKYMCRMDKIACEFEDNTGFRNLNKKILKGLKE